MLSSLNCLEEPRRWPVSGARSGGELEHSATIIAVLKRESGNGVDVPILDLGGDARAWIPPSVPFWAADGLRDRVSVFGFPIAKGDL
jgi:hypothetical protein